MRTTLQIPMTKTLKTQATLSAKKMGFSSLQELVRVMITQLIKGQLQFEFVTPSKTIKLSPSAEKRYLKILADIKTHKEKLISFNNSADLAKYLNEAIDED